MGNTYMGNEMSYHQIFLEGVVSSADNFLRMRAKKSHKITNDEIKLIKDSEIIIPARLGELLVPTSVTIPKEVFKSHSNEQGADREIDITQMQVYIDNSIMMFYQGQDDKTTHYKYLYLGAEYTIVVGKLKKDSDGIASIITTWITVEDYHKLSVLNRDKQKEILTFINEVRRCLGKK